MFDAHSGRRHCSGVPDDCSLVVGCVNACSAAPLSRAVVDERLDVLVITETWHEGPESTTLKRIATPRYQEAARPISPDAVTNTVDFQNHGGSYPVLTVGADTAVASSHVRLLGDDISLDLSVDRHVSRVCAGCFYQLRQLRRIPLSLDSDLLATLIYAVVNS